MTTHSWDENPNGVWTLEIENVAGASDYGKDSFILHIKSMSTFKFLSPGHQDSIKGLSCDVI